MVRLASAAAVLSAALAATAAAVFASGPTSPPARPVPPGCLWEWGGPGFGWTLVTDGCHGKCPEPPAAGTYIGQTELSRCTGP